MVVLQEPIDSPPQKCLNMVALIIGATGKPIAIANVVIGGPIFTSKLLLIALNNQYARFKSALLFPEKAISVFEKLRLVGIFIGIKTSANLRFPIKKEVFFE